MSDIAPMQTTPPRPSFWRNLSAVWLVPLAAVIISLGIAWKSWSDRGIMVEITFENAGGVVAGETALRLRDVPIGMVEKVSFAPDLKTVVLSTRIDKDVADNIPADAQFWIVRPQVSARGISGLSTVLSGVYLETAFIPAEDADIRSFTGLDQAPLVTPGREGSHIRLRADDGNRLTPGAPVIFHGIQVGHIEQPRLAEGAGGVWVDAFIEAPHDQRISTATRFWDTSGFSVSFGMAGLRLGVGNLASLLTGGIAFDTTSTSGTAPPEGAIFELYPDEATARASVVSGVGAEALRITAEFDQSVQGLNSGADVRFNGLNVGKVITVGARIADGDAGPVVKMQVSMALDPQAMGLAEGKGPQDLVAFLDTQVAAGLRARLSAARFFGNSLAVELIEIPDAEPAALTALSDGMQMLPTVVADLPNFSSTAEGLVQRLSKLPIEGVMEQAISLMASAESLISLDSTRAVPQSAMDLLDQARALLGSDQIKAIPAEAMSVLSDLRAILTSFTEQKVTERLAEALQATETAATEIAALGGEVPPVMADLRNLIAKVQELKAEELVDAATRLVSGADEFVRADSTRQLAPALSGALGEVQSALSELRAGGTVENVNATLSSTRSAAEAIALASRDLPALASRLDQLVAQAEGLVSAYGARSPVNDELLSALREARATARAFSQLARTLERNPNSLLFGR